MTDSATGADSDSGSDSGSGSAIGRVTIATIIAAASGYVVLLLAARHLGAAGYAVFAVFWAAYGMVTGTQNGQLQETARAVRAAREDGDTAGARPLPVNLLIGLTLAALIAVTSPLWATHLFTKDTWISVALLVFGVASFAVYAHLCGALSGAAAWGTFAALLSVDALIRLAAALVAVIAGCGLTAFLVITVLGSISWMLLLAASSTARAIIGIGGDITADRLRANTLTAMAAAAAAAVLVMGFPVLINLTRHNDNDAVLGAVILAVTLTRAPLLVPLNSFQGFLITRFVDRRSSIITALAVPVGIVVAIGSVGALAAGLLGPWMMTTVFGADYELSGGALAGFTFGATTLAVLTITGAAAVAAHAHRVYALGWWLGTAVSAALLLLPAELTVRTTIALICGPLVGIALHLFGITRATRAPARA